MSSCEFIPKVKNKQGELVDSELFSSLLHYSKDREFTKKYYMLGLATEFLEALDSYETDENGEITFKDLKKWSGLSVSKERLKETLNKEAKVGVHEYDDAVRIINDFNSNNAYNDTYLATITPLSDGKVEISVVEKSEASLKELETTVKNRTLRDRIKYRLAKLGVDYSFMDTKEGVNGRYSTINAEKNADGLYNLIQISNKASDIDEALAEESGHLAIGALGNNPLVQRLERLLTPEVQKSILGNEYNTISTRSNPAREVAGHLVGKAILGEVDTTQPWSNLLTRVVDKIKTMFNKLTGKDIQNDRLYAEQIAKDIARDFMSDGFLGTVENAVSTQEIMYSATDSVNVSVFKEVLARLKLQTYEMEAISKTLKDKYKNINIDVSSGRLFTHPSDYADEIAFEGIIDAVKSIVNITPELIERFNKIDFNKGKIEHSDTKTLRELRTLLSNSTAIIKIVDDATSSDSSTRFNIIPDGGMDILNEVKTQLKGITESLLSELEVKEKEIHLVFLQSILGKDYINRSARVLFNFKKGQKFIKKVEATSTSIDKLLRYMDKDITFIEFYISSMSNSSDVIGQISDKAVKLFKHLANTKTLDIRNQLLGLRKQLLELGINNTDMFCEKSAITGKLTGNIISRHNWGDFENAWQIFKAEHTKEFYKNTDTTGKTDFQLEIMFDVYFKPLAKKWYAENADYNEAKKMWVPNESYNNDFYIQNIENNVELRTWLDTYKSIKLGLDKLLPEGSTKSHRMPQFKGTTMNKIRNKKLFENAKEATINTVRENIKDTFLEDSEDTDFGHNETYNTLDSDDFTDRLDFDKEKLRRLPMYGINKMKDPSLISTDLFHSTLAYADMATRYHQLSRVVDIMEIGRSVLERRSVKGMHKETERHTASKAFRSYSSFLDSQVYGIAVKKKMFGKLVVNKLISFYNGLASKVYIGGNALGGVVNVMTGTIEIIKEAMAGEHYDLKDLKAAIKEYYRCLPSNMVNMGEDVKQDKVSLFIDKMNALNNNNDDFRNMFTRKSKFVKLNPLGENLYMPYKGGEHFMQSMAFLAIAHRLKLEHENGSVLSLYDALQETEALDSKGNPTGTKTLELKEGYKIRDKETGELVPWNYLEESRFMDEAREVNNRMHGIYNKMDKTKFQSNIYGNAVTAMRGYALGMIQRRYGSNIHSVALGRDSEGSVRTVAKMLIDAAVYKQNIALTARAIFLPFVDKKVKQDMLEAGYSVDQYMNMRRNFADLLFISSLYLIKLLVSKDGEDDDDKKNKRKVRSRSTKSNNSSSKDEIPEGILYYFASRLLSEQSAFNTPWGLSKESSALTEIKPIGLSFAMDMATLLEMGFYDVVGSEEGKYAKSGKGYNKGDSKFLHRVERMLPYYKSYLRMQNPYEAAEAYQYGRTVVR